MVKICTVESVTEGHPDKLADLIADSILDECLKQDESSRVACEVMLSNKKVYIVGEITTKAKVDYKQMAIDTITEVGYLDFGDVYVDIQTQSQEISDAVNRESGAGDQGIVYGYACNETYNFMPLSVNIAQSIIMALTDWRKLGLLGWLRPDGKAQVSVQYDNGKFDHISTIVVSVQHDKDKDVQEIRQELKDMLTNNLLVNYDLSKTEFIVNSSGSFVVGGFEADTGLTGRKLMVDSYGGLLRHGGGAFCGKDFSKTDRSGAYLARYIAKNVVAAGMADACEVSIAYAIGKNEPVAFDVTLFNGVVSDEVAKGIVRKVFDLTPSGAIEMLDLKRPIYKNTAVGGHFGRDEFPWEKVDKILELRALFK